MNLIELSYYLQNEESAREYLLDQGILKRFTKCPHCNSEKIGNIRRDRMKCYKCKKEWHRRKYSFLETRHISYTKFIGILKLYSAEYSIDAIGIELEIERKTVTQIILDIQKLILPVFNYTEQKFAKLFVYKNKIVLEPIKTIEDKMTSFDDIITLEFCRYKELGSIYSFMIKSTRCKGKKYKYNVLDRFLSYSKMRLISYRGIGIKNLYSFLSELVIKFNLGENNFYNYVLKNLHFLRVVETTQSL